MAESSFQLQAPTPFSESLLWQINRDFYLEAGLKAWQQNTVPHHLTSNSMVGRTYAELIFAVLKDLSAKGKVHEKVYIVELGAGHGRLAFHLLKHLDRLTAQLGLNLPEYCYVLTDIIEESLDFFLEHPQFHPFFKKGKLDVAYFDAIGGKELFLRFSKKKIVADSLNQPLLVLANYFFDSIPNDLFQIKDQQLHRCAIGLETDEDPEGMSPAMLLKKMTPVFSSQEMNEPCYNSAVLNEMLADYQELLTDAYLFFPKSGLQCLDNLRQFSPEGMIVISMDKGFHQIHDLNKSQVPEIITHGSFSIWVNYHALGLYCNKMGGAAMFPSGSTFYLDLACLLFLPDSDAYTELYAAYQRVVNDFGPDDFNGLKRLTYQNMSRMSLAELIAILRLSAYDSTMFQNVLPRIKQVARQITVNERTRLVETMHQTWAMYFNLNEAFDLAYEMGGLLYDLGAYQDALGYFQFSVDQFGSRADVYYNQALCYYQLRADDLFLQTLLKAKTHFPAYDRFAELEKLDLGAE